MLARRSLKRQLHSMPEFVKLALVEHDLMRAYQERPPYQHNDYVGWIKGVKREATRQKPLLQMLNELTVQDCYMRMAWRPGRSR